MFLKLKTIIYPLLWSNPSFTLWYDDNNIEDMNHGVINVVLILSLILITKNTKFDIMDNINKFLTVRLLPFL